MNKKISKLTAVAQRGFTLIELVVVVAIIGVLIAIVAPNVIGTKDGANTQLLAKTSQNIATNWSLINQSCGTSTGISSNPLADAGKSPEDVVFKGVDAVHEDYKNCYAQSKVLALSEVAQPGVGGTGYNVAGFKITFAEGGNKPLEITYAAVPENLILLLAQKYDPNFKAGDLAAAGGSVGGAMKYGVISGTGDVTFMKQI